MARKKRTDEEILAEANAAREFLARSIASFFNLGGSGTAKRVEDLKPSYAIRLARQARKALERGEEPTRKAARGHRNTPEHGKRNAPAGAATPTAKAAPAPKPSRAQAYRQAVNLRLTTRQKLEAVPTRVQPTGQQTFIVNSSEDALTVEAIRILGTDLPSHVLTVGWEDRDGKYHTFYERGIRAKDLLDAVFHKHGSPSKKWFDLMAEIYEAAYNLEEPEADDFQKVSIFVAPGYFKRV